MKHLEEFPKESLKGYKRKFLRNFWKTPLRESLADILEEVSRDILEEILEGTSEPIRSGILKKKSLIQILKFAWRNIRKYSWMNLQSNISRNARDILGEIPGRITAVKTSRNSWWDSWQRILRIFFLGKFLKKFLIQITWGISVRVFLKEFQKKRVNKLL